MVTEAEVSEIQRAIGGLQADVRTLLSQWADRERNASEQRREVRTSLVELSLDVNNLKRDVAAMQPLVDAGRIAALKEAGVRSIFKALWHVLSALLGALGATFVNWFSKGPPLPPTH